MKKTLKEDLNGKLNDVSRAWIRKPATFILSFVVFIVAIPFGIIETWKQCWFDFTVKCWKGISD